MADGADPVVDIRRDGKSLAGGAERPRAIRVIKALYGVLDDPARTRDVTARLRKLVESGVYAFKTTDMASDGDPAYLVVKTLKVDYEENGRTLTASALDTQAFAFDATPAPEPPVRLAVRDGRTTADIAEAGAYEFVTASGRRSAVTAAPRTPQEIAGPWEVAFDPKWGGPEKPVVFARPEDWAQRPEPEIRHYSGTAVYRTQFSVSGVRAPDARFVLDLGRVEVMARVDTSSLKCVRTVWLAWT